MEGCWKGIPTLLVVLAVLAASGSSYQIVEGPKNATVLKGSEARFNCSVSQGWMLIMWALNGTVVLSLTPKEPIITNNRFTSASYEVDGNFVSEMIIHDVQLSDAGHIKCSLQNSDRDGSAYLSVQVMGTLLIPSSLVVTEDEPCNVTCRAVGWLPLPDIAWEIGVPVSHSSYYSFPEPDDLQSAVSILTLTPQGDGTLTCVANLKGLDVHKSAAVNLTVIEPPSGNTDKPGTSLPTWAIILLAVLFSLLLILIIVLIIIFCCCVSRREKKESSYQSEIRKSANVKTNKEMMETKIKSGNENYGYRADESRTTKISSLPPKSYEPSVPVQCSTTYPQQGPDGHQPAPVTRPHVSFIMASPRKVRNVTLV
ncbi:immunoglobulin superfamily member 5 isoform X1 [Elephas maximus indicus]|uniref:immunoglobulin superfamily member 5 isoform X1 n=1 Tax=Elephas maximus indicus TaxID=99487 RepID=UPI0021168F92|nr:immunoglobulin superfamily member 5 isoform X1 [Elephas maximus indicus]XP_049730857.1 immunoglobulin superfamily member 5 isoform X1 [Elephas maximus indicus]